MGEDIQKICRFDWQISGILAGWIIIAMSFGQTLLFYSQHAESDFYYYGNILFIGEYQTSYSLDFFYFVEILIKIR